MGASEELTDNLKRLTVQVSMRLSTSIEYLRGMPARDFLDIVQDIVESDRARDKK